MNLDPGTGEGWVERVRQRGGLAGFALQKLGAKQAESHNEGATRFHELTARERGSENVSRSLTHGGHRLPPLRHHRGGMLYGFQGRKVSSEGAISRQRPRCGDGPEFVKASLICARVGCGLLSSNSVALIIMPF